MNRLPKHVTLKHLNAFVAVAQESSFTRAAERLFQTQSSVTSLVRQLEEALSTLLFARTSRRVLLTAAGEEFLPRVMRLLADFDGAIGDVVRFGALERGRVGVAAAPSAITQIIARRRRLRRAPSRRALVPERRQLRPHPAQGGRARGRFRPDQPLGGRARAGFRAAAGRPLRRAVPRGRRRAAPGRDGTVRWADLAGRQLVGVVDETGIIALLRARADLPIEAAAPFHEASSTTSQAALVKAGLGVALLPALAAERVREPGLAYALLARPTMVRTVCLIRHLDYPLSPAADALIGAIRDYLKTAELPPGCAAPQARGQGLGT